MITSGRLNGSGRSATIGDSLRSDDDVGAASGQVHSHQVSIADFGSRILTTGKNLRCR
jgi:hypothetical protein